MVNVVLLGSPGSGKGTMARMLWEKHGVSHISTGDLLRQEILNETDIGKQIAPILSSGKLVDNSIVSRVLTKAVKNAKSGFVLDGFPRNSEQVRILEKILRETKQKIDFVIELNATDKKVVERLSSRRQCPKCGKVYGFNAPPKKEGLCDNDHEKLFQREDDKSSVILERLKIYHRETLPLLAYFKDKAIVKSVDADKSINQVFKDVSKILFKGK